MRNFLLATTAFIFICTPAMAGDTSLPKRKPLQPRVESNLRAGTERSIAVAELWAPLDQSDSSVLYGDLRLMGDDHENNEFNAGIGYRFMTNNTPLLGDGVVGLHGWFDRRKTERGSKFNQLTAGAEWYGDVLDLKLNTYLPLNNHKTHSAGTSVSAPYLAGSGIFYDTRSATVKEEAQPGIDLEVGFRLPLEKAGIDFTDTTRVYAGGYHFAGDKADDVTGWRARIASDITQDIQVGARFQKDDVRGSQAFLEATIRFPFGNKKSYREEGLYARLDESPERDIDIVTSTTQPVATGPAQVNPVLNTTTQTAQRVLYVDNAAAGGGNGSIETPYNVLKTAEAALQDNDVLYIRRGNGTTANQNLGLIVNRANVSIIGSGSDFVFDNGKFSAGANLQGSILIAKTTAPVITNITPNGGSLYVGNGVLIQGGGNSLLAGLNIQAVNNNGVFIEANGAGSHFGSLSSYDMTIANQGTRGFIVRAMNSGTFDTVTLNNINIDANLANAGNVNLGVYADTNGIIDTATISNIVSRRAGGVGINIGGTGNGQIHNVSVSNSSALNNAGQGMQVYANTGTRIGFASLNNLDLRNNSSNGLYFTSTGAPTSNPISAVIQNSRIEANGQDGIRVNDDSTNTLALDFGGGSFNGVGRNSIFGNGTAGGLNRDVILDMDAAAPTLPMQYNWWGQAGGPIAGRIRNENNAGACNGAPNFDCGVANTANALSSAP